MHYSSTASSLCAHANHIGVLLTSRSFPKPHKFVTNNSVNAAITGEFSIYSDKPANAHKKEEPPETNLRR